MCDSRWIKDSDQYSDGQDRYYCSNCKQKCNGIFTLTMNYCPNCGAKMKTKYCLHDLRKEYHETDLSLKKYIPKLISALECFSQKWHNPHYNDGNCNDCILSDGFICCYDAYLYEDMLSILNQYDPNTTIWQDCLPVISKVLTGLECHKKRGYECEKCPYDQIKDNCFRELCLDAISMLKIKKNE